MKLRFTINYGTQWGESLHVVIAYRSLDGTVRNSNLLMTTDDGFLWTLETSAVESRQHPIASFTYFYQVEDGEGNVLRCEWRGVPRSYHFDTSKSYVLPDQWRDIPLQYHLYSSAYATTMGLPRCEECEVLRVPLYRKTILFRVSAPQLEKGQSLKHFKEDVREIAAGNECGIRLDNFEEFEVGDRLELFNVVTVDPFAN